MPTPVDKSPAGRKPWFIAHPERLEVLCRQLQNGVPNVLACKAAMLAESTFYLLLQKARDFAELREAGQELDAEQLAHIAFAERVKGAETDAVNRNCMVIMAAAPNHWQAAAWWLERRYPQLFGRHVIVDGGGNSDAGPKRVASPLKPPELPP